MTGQGGEKAHGVGLGPALVLTEEELAVLEQAHLRSLIDAEDGAPSDAGAGEARRSLVGRGLLTPHGTLPDDTDLGLLLQTMLDVRVAAEALVVVERLLGEGRRDLRLLHLVPQGGVVEDVHPDGLHGLDLALGPADLVAAVMQMVVPDDATAGQGLDVSVGPDELAGLPELLGRPTVLAELTVLRPDEEEATGHLVALGPDGCWAGERPSGQGPPEGLRLSPVGPERVAELVQPWIHGVVAEQRGGTMAG